ncbi:MAG: PilZ domain-containing protein [Nitrospirae bacterium]|nr:PilZ domain-containing protein [Nitrospirota bacterium]
MEGRVIINHSSSFADRRKYPRGVCNLPVGFSLTVLESYELKKLSAEGKCIDISRGGACLATSFPLEEGHVLKFNDSEIAAVNPVGVVRWTAGEAPDIKAGVQFIASSRND